MRNDDLSQNSGHPTANDDYDVIPAGHGNSAAGNTITGKGTVSGAAGADEASGAHVTAITGAAGGSGESMEAAGRYGSIKIDAQGNYTYTRNHGSPDNVEDVFTYTLADKGGALDSARLVIRIDGKEDQAKIQDNAQRIVAGNEVITLPAGVELSDIHVVGRDLVINLPDGTQMVIVDGAVFVPQLALGDVELPSDTLAQLLIDSEPRPAAGPPESSGGNFGEPVAPLDPGVPLGDLLPPTELGYTPPDFDETYIPQKPDEPDSPPVIEIQPDGQPASVSASDEVDEAGLNSPPNDHAGTQSASDSETVNGEIIFSSPDGVDTISITINGTSYVIYGSGAVSDIPGDYGTLHINSVNVADGTASYTYTLNNNVDHDSDPTPWEDFSVSLEDSDGDIATATLRINIADDAPIANPDVDSVTEDGVLVADGNVFTGSGGADANSTDGVADVQGADGAAVTSFRFGETAGVLGGAALNSAHGSLTLTSGGTYVYTVNNLDPAVQALGAGETMTEIFNYSITDNDGDVRETTLTITIVGTNDRPSIVSGATSVTEEAFLAPEDNAGNPDGVGNPTDNASAASASGQLTLADADGDALTVTLSAPAGSYSSHGDTITWAVSPDGHTLTGSANGASVIVVTIDNAGNYTVNLLEQFDHPVTGTSPATSEDILSLGIGVHVTDGTASVDGTLTVNVEDDSPIVTGPATLGVGVDIDESDSGTSVLSPAGAITVTSAGAVIAAPVAYGGDGPGGAAVYTITLNGAVEGYKDSGLVTADGDHAITLHQIDATHIEGLFNDGSDHVAFTVTINANGSITVTQNYALEHSDDGSSAVSHNDTNSPLTLDGLINANVTYQDFDHDTVGASGGIGQLIRFFDDGPSIDVTVDAKPTDPQALAALALTTQDDGTEGPSSTTDSDSVNLAGLFHSTTDGGADGEASSSLVFTLDLIGDSVGAPGVDSGLESHDATIYLYQIDADTIIGSTSATLAGAGDAANIVFQLSTTAGGTVTLTQYQQIDHDTVDPTPGGAPFADHIVSLGGGLINLVGTGNVVDNDGDTDGDIATLDMGGLVRFQDDGPAIDASLKEGAHLIVDESQPGLAAGESEPAGTLGQVSVAISALITVNDTSVSADAPTTYGYALVLGPPSGGLVASGLMTSAGDLPIYLYVQADGSVVGSTALNAGSVDASNTVFSVALSGDDVVLTQFQAIEHGDAPLNYNELSGALASGALGLQVTATDYDGDTSTDTVDLGSVIQFNDDGPTAQVTVGGLPTDPAALAAFQLVTGDDGTEGPLSTTDSTTANFGGLFGLTADGGSDGTAASGLTFDLDLIGAGDGPVDSGLDSQGQSIFLYQVGPNAVVGSTSATAAGVTLANSVFLLATNDAGVVTLTQYQQVDHPIGADPSATGAPFTDQFAILDSGLVQVVATGSVTDNDGDIATDTKYLDLGGLVKFADDGPAIDATIKAGAAIHIDESLPGTDNAGETDAVGLGQATVALSAVVNIADTSVSADAPTTYGYALVLGPPSGGLVASGLMTSDGNLPIYLYNVGGNIVGSTALTSGTVGLGNTVFTVALSGGNVVMTQYQAIEHTNTSSFDENSSPLASGALNLLVTATDYDGDTGTDTIDLGSIITFGDDGPVASDRTLPGTQTENANVVVDVTADIDGGSDGLANVQFVSTTGLGSVTYDPVTQEFTYHPGSGEQGVISFTYRVFDNDGDHDDATVTFELADSAPVAIDVTAKLDDDGLAGGNAASTAGDIVANDASEYGAGVGNEAIWTGHLGVSSGGADTPLTYSLAGMAGPGGLVGTENVSYGWNALTNTLTATTTSGGRIGTILFTVQITDTHTGDYQITLVNPIMHATQTAPGDETSAPDVVLSYTVSDSDTPADTDTGTITITFNDDAPTAALALKSATFLVIDETDNVTANGFETDGPGGNLGVATMTAGDLYVNTSVFGADGAAASNSAVYSLAVNGLSVAGSSLATTMITSVGNLPITLYLMADGSIVGSTAGSFGAVNAGNTVFSVSIAANGTTTMTQFQAVEHTDFPSNYDETATQGGLPANGIQVVLTVKDADGDLNSAAVDLGSRIRFEDDGPSVSGTVNGAGNVVLDETATSSIASTITLTGITKGDDLDVAGTGAIARAVGTASVVNASPTYGSDGQGAPLAYALSIQNASSGLTLTDGTAINLVLNNGNIVGVVAGGALVGQAAFAISINSATGVLTVEQYLSIQHPNAANSDDAVNMTAGHIGVVITATDGDNDTAASTAVDISTQVSFEDDGPSVSGTVNGQGAVTLDETATSSIASTITLTGGLVKGDDPDVGGTGAIAKAVGSAAIVTPSPLYGADGPHAAPSLAYALSIQNATSGLKVTDGSAITLSMNNGNIVGIVSGGTFNGQVAFAIQIDPVSGALTVEQYLSIQHPNAANPDDGVSMSAGHIGVVITATDGDNDTASSTAVDISNQITFEDDGPSVSGTVNTAGAVILDETATSSIASTITLTGGVVKGDDPDVGGTGAIAKAVGGASIVNAAPLYGADGQGAALSYALSIQNASSGLTLTDGSAINLVINNGNIVGIVAGGTFNGQAAFAISINPATGVLTVEQYLSINHPNAGDPDDAVSMTAGHIGVVITATDGDLDTAPSTAVDISTRVSFEDDGPSISGSANAGGIVTLDETATSSIASTITLSGGLVKGDDPNVTGTGAIAKSVGGAAIVSAVPLYGADGAHAAPSLNYALSIQNAASGLKVTDGSNINLQMNGNVIVGVVSGGTFNGQVALAIAIDPATGVATVEQYLSLQHPNTGDPDDSVNMTSGHIGVTVTATDGDNDTANTGVIDVSTQIRFEDDGPSVSGTINTGGDVAVDETALSSIASTITLTGGAVKGDDPDVTGAGAIAKTVGAASILNLSPLYGSDGQGPNPTYGLSIQNAASGLKVTDGSSINLSMNNGSIIGTVSGGTFNGQVAFAIAIDPSSGIVTVEQYLSLQHTDTSSNDETINMTAGHIGVTATVTDGDNDTATTGVVDFSTNITFDDDGPSTFTPQAATTTNNAAGIFNGALDFGDAAGLTNNYGADGGKAVFTLTGLPSTQTSGGVALFYTLSNGDQTLTATAGNGGPVVYTATITGSTYTIDVVNPIDSLSTIDFTGGAYDHPGGNPDYYAFFIAGNNDSQDLLITPLQNGVTGGTINLNGNLFGVSTGNDVGAGDSVRLDYVRDLVTSGNSIGNWTFEQHYVVNGATVEMAKATNATVKLTAYDDPDGNNTVGDGVVDSINKIVISYNGGSQIITPTAVDTMYTIGGHNFYVKANGDGTVSVGGVTGDTNGITPTTIGVFTANGYNSLVLTYENGTHGSDSFKVGGFGAAVQNTDPVIFDIPVKIVDGDGDTVAGSPIHVTLNAAAPPVLLDTNHDGHVSFLGVDAGVLYDMNGDGHLDHTAWAAPGDSILFFDADHNGTVSGANEFVFGGNGVTDLEALHAMYGAQLDASDANFAMFGLWNDANSNGVVDAGEASTLAEAGVTSVQLVSDGVASSEADGDVQVSGTGSYSYVNDNGGTSTGKLVDAAFRYTAINAEDEQRLAANATNTTLLAVAAAAAAVADSAAAATHDAGSDHATVEPQVGIVAPPSLVADIDDTGPLASPLLSSDELHIDPVAISGHRSAVVTEESNVALDHSSDADAAPAAPAPANDTPLPQVMPTADVAPMTVAAEAIAPEGAGGGHHNAVVSSELIQQPETAIDQLLAKLGGNDAIESLAQVQSDGKAVQGWDTAGFGHLPVGVMEHIGGEASLLHPDAVQPVMHG